MAPRKQTMLNIYLYAICLVSVAVFLVVVGIGLWGVVQMVFPQLTLNDYEYQRISSFERFKKNESRAKISDPERAGAEAPPSLPEDELRRLWEEEKQLTLNAERRSGLREFVRMWIWMIIVVPIYVFHWRMARRLKDPSEDSVVPG